MEENRFYVILFNIYVWSVEWMHKELDYLLNNTNAVSIWNHTIRCGHISKQRAYWGD